MKKEKRKPGSHWLEWWQEAKEVMASPQFRAAIKSLRDEESAPLLLSVGG